MEQFKRMLHKLLFPRTAAVIISVPVAAALLIYTFLFKHEDSPVAYLSYVISAYSLVIVCIQLVKLDKSNFKSVLHCPPLRRGLPYMTIYLPNMTPFRRTLLSRADAGVTYLHK